MLGIAEVTDHSGHQHGADIGGEGELKLAEVDVVQQGGKHSAHAGGHDQQDGGVGEGVGVHALGLGLLLGVLVVDLHDLVLRLGGGQTVAVDDGPGSGAAHQGAGHQTEGGGGDGQHVGTGDAQLVLHQRTVGTGGAVAAHHGDGAGAQAQTHIPAKYLSQRGAHHVLQAHHHNGNDQEGEHLFAALFQQTEAGGITHAGKEQGHKEALHVVIKAQLDNAAGIEDQMNDSEDQSAYHGGGDAAALQEFDAGGQEASQDEQQHSHACRLVHIKGKFWHIVYSFSLNNIWPTQPVC